MQKDFSKKDFLIRLVHTQLTLILKNGVRRRLQQISQVIGDENEVAKSNQIRHFVGSTNIVLNKDIFVTEVVDDEQESDNAVVLVSFFGLFAVVLNLIFYV